jgi:hypothetical protein
MNVRPGVPYVQSPNRSFTSNGYSELLASGFEYKIEDRKVDIAIPKSIPFDQRQMWIERFKTLGFDSISNFTTVNNELNNTIDISFVVDEVG